MKVYIGPYKNWIGPYQIANAVFFWVKRTGIYADEPEIYKRWDYRAEEKLGDWLSETWVNTFCNWIDKLKDRKIKVHIDDYDVWSADHTLAYIIHPTLIKLKEKKHGSPDVDDEDVPEELRSTSAPPTKEPYDTDDNFHKRWDWVLNEMIWAFETHLDTDADNKFHTGTIDMQWKEVEYNGKTMHEMIRGPNDTHVFDKEGWEKWNERKRNGFRLFGKYYQALWD